MKKKYSDKFPSLPYKKKKKSGRFDRSEDYAKVKRPEPFDGLNARKKEAERQHFPLLSMHIDVITQLNAISSGREITVSVSVTNNGGGSAYTPFVELIETSYWAQINQSPDPTLFHRRGYLMLSVLYPHQTRTVEVPWSRKLKNGRFIGICYDPLLDPRPKIPFASQDQPPFHRKIISIPWLKPFAPTNLGVKL